MLNQTQKPLIGIPTRINYNDDSFYLRRYYSEAIYNAGGIPVYLPLIPEVDYIETVANNLDGVVLSGNNSDVDPLRYGQGPHIKLGTVSDERDETDLLLLQACESRKLPILAVCYGMQILNVYRGGTLFQDLESQIDEVLKHQQEGSYTRVSHSIKIKEESLLAILAGGNTARVNSHHHQGVDTLGRDLEPIAWSADGLVEAVINTRVDQFILGVQWHPEAGWEKDSLSQALFKHFISRTMRR
ncbi:MAG: gamma-glutamyl-gamma-aminobutyrate hydrolase family protein [Blastocatellia bacterium]|nr:gamma-glutamyl-gamma-aminobutyrate hydrolase family protein [Blastocatellia bacterium]MBN8723437.1 gamma-glutamyl-gamma-aminobutyrate hydrolase family protein [Acidobacteriota bacterium]